MMKIHFKPSKFELSTVTPDTPWTGSSGLGTANIEIGGTIPPSGAPVTGQAFSLHDVAGDISGVSMPDVAVNYCSVYSEGYRAPVTRDTVYVYREVVDFMVTDKKIKSESAMANKWNDSYNEEVYLTFRGYAPRFLSGNSVLSLDVILLASPSVVLEDCDTGYFYKCDKSGVDAQISVFNPEEIFIELRVVSNLKQHITD